MVSLPYISIWNYSGGLSRCVAVSRVSLMLNKDACLVQTQTLPCYKCGKGDSHQINMSIKNLKLYERLGVLHIDEVYSYLKSRHFQIKSLIWLSLIWTIPDFGLDGVGLTWRFACFLSPQMVFWSQITKTWACFIAIESLGASNKRFKRSWSALARNYIYTGCHQHWRGFVGACST